MSSMSQRHSQASVTEPRRFELRNLRLYQKESELEGRIDVDALADFAKQLQADFANDAGGIAPKVEGVLVAVAIRPGRRQRVWCELVGNSSQTVTPKLEKRLSSARPPEAKALVAFGLNFVREGRNPILPELPHAWNEIAIERGRTLKVPEEVVAALWPE